MQNVLRFRLKVYFRRIHQSWVRITQNTKHPEIIASEQVRKFGLIALTNDSNSYNN